MDRDLRLRDHLLLLIKEDHRRFLKLHALRKDGIRDHHIFGHRILDPLGHVDGVGDKVPQLIGLAGFIRLFLNLQFRDRDPGYLEGYRLHLSRHQRPAADVLAAASRLEDQRPPSLPVLPVQIPGPKAASVGVCRVRAEVELIAAADYRVSFTSGAVGLIDQSYALRQRDGHLIRRISDTGHRLRPLHLLLGAEIRLQAGGRELKIRSGDLGVPFDQFRAADDLLPGLFAHSQEHLPFAGAAAVDVGQKAVGEAVSPLLSRPFLRDLFAQIVLITRASVHIVQRLRKQGIIVQKIRREGSPVRRILLRLQTISQLPVNVVIKGRIFLIINFLSPLQRHILGPGFKRRPYSHPQAYRQQGACQKHPYFLHKISFPDTPKKRIPYQNTNRQLPNEKTAALLSHVKFLVLEIREEIIPCWGNPVNKKN